MSLTCEVTWPLVYEHVTEYVREEVTWYPPDVRVDKTSAESGVISVHVNADDIII